MTDPAFTSCWYSAARVIGRLSGLPYNDKASKHEARNDVCQIKKGPYVLLQLRHTRAVVVGSVTRILVSRVELNVTRHAMYA